MANIIDTTYFHGDLAVGQLTSAAVAAGLQWKIDQLEPRLLIELLGYELYKSFIALPNTTRHQDILNGKEYTNRAGRVTKWFGLKRQVTAAVDGPPAIAATYSSLIANYVYYYYTKQNNTFTTGAGEGKAKVQNMEQASPRRKLAKAWNDMVDDNCELVEFLLSFPDVYPEFVRYYGDARLDRLLMKLNPIF
jgi:hypothetical protein